jgi:lysozyme family protein
MQHPFSVLSTEYASSLARMVITDSAHVEQAVKEILPGKVRYKAVEAVTKIPAAGLGAVDYREDDCNPRDGLGQGDPWNKVSINVPAGKGPFLSWQAAAIFYLHYDKVDVFSAPWTWAYACWKGEMWNGFGPRDHGVHTGYLWGCTSIYTGGMYPHDHEWSSTAKDGRPGIIPIMKRLQSIDSDFIFDAAISDQPFSPTPILPPPEGINNALWVQQSLNKLGQTPPLIEDGNYGRRTRTAVAIWQSTHDLDDDGLAGPLTTAAIKVALAL